MALGTIAAIGGLVSAGSSILGGRKAKKDAKNAARQQEAMGREQAGLIAAETEEELRRYDLDTAKTLGMGEALSSASGFSAGSSQDNYLDSLRSEFATERDWTERVSKQRQSIAKKTGQYSASNLRSQGSAALWSGMGQGIAKGISSGGALGHEMGWL